MRFWPRRRPETAEQRRLRRAGCTWPLAHTGAALERDNDIAVSASYSDHLAACRVTAGDTTIRARSRTLGTIVVSHDDRRAYESIVRDAQAIKDLIRQYELGSPLLNVELVGELRDQLAAKVAEADRLTSTWTC